MRLLSRAAASLTYDSLINCCCFIKISTSYVPGAKVAINFTKNKLIKLILSYLGEILTFWLILEEFIGDNLQVVVADESEDFIAHGSGLDVSLDALEGVKDCG